MGENVSVSLACQKRLVSFQSSTWCCASTVRSLVFSNGELGNWQVTLVSDMTSPLATLGIIHAGV